jgi:hypothetical protein
MSQAQIANEVKYKMALSLLKSMLEKGLITLSEFMEVDQINQCLYTPQLVEVYM